MNIKWADEITNEELWSIAHQKSIEYQIKRRKQNWIGHTFRKETGALEKTALDWNPQGYRRRGRLKRTWRRTIEDSGVPRGGFGLFKSPSPKFRKPSKIVPN